MAAVLPPLSLSETMGRVYERLVVTVGEMRYTDLLSTVHKHKEYCLSGVGKWEFLDHCFVTTRVRHTQYLMMVNE